MKNIRKIAIPIILTSLLTPFAWAGNTTHDVVIVGAGSAGLYAAKTLINDGYDVLIIEATDIIGGRVKSHTLGSTRIEMGAEEHYGSTNNPIWPAIRGEYGNSIYVDGYQGSEVYSMDGGINTCWDTNNAVIKCSSDSDVTDNDALFDWYWDPKNHNDTDTMAQSVEKEYGVDANHRAYHLYDEGFAGGNYATSLHKIGAKALALQPTFRTIL
ncbi:MAG: NAD(P)-binding protein [Alteromonadaceae bacterium]|nr:NAD(P)-binding protein [Alteromonadaceae bacterium]